MVITSWLDRSRNAIAQGALTNSKRPESYILGCYPTHIKTANGCHLFDSNDTRYIDFICGLGSNLFGYGNEHITQAVMKHIYAGANHSLPTVHEVEAAESLKALFPWCDRVKWLKTGSDACNAAIRFARAATGRHLVLSDGYHGWSDQFVSMTEPAAGISKQISIIPLTGNEFSISNAAAVIVEPIMLDYSIERIRYLKRLSEDCKKHGAVLIFDEVITGMRWRKYSVSNDFGIRPDLTCFGKAIGGGYSLAAVAGRADILDNQQVFVSSTYAGEVPPLVAAKAAMEIIQKKSDYDMNYLWQKGQEFIYEFNKLGGVQLTGYPTRGALVGTPDERALFCQEMAKSHILFHPSTWFFNFPLIKVMDDVLDITEAVKYRIRSGAVRLEYPLPESPFAAKVRRQE